MPTNNEVYIQRIIRTLESIDDEHDREQALGVFENLAGTDPDQTITALRDIIDQRMLARYDYALYLLFELSPAHGTEAALSLLKTGTPDMRWYACEILSAYGTSATVAPLLDCAQHDSDADVRCAAILTLGQFANQDALPVLYSIRDTDLGITQLGHRIRDVTRRVIDDIQRARATTDKDTL